MTDRPRVFVTQENAMLNYAPAEHFGEVVFLTSRETSPIAGSLANATIVDEVSRRLADFDFERDYICPSGSPTVTGVAFFLLGQQTARAPANRTLRVLRWSNRDRVYQLVPLNV